ncbi:unnamed protein product, partial [Urochloa humidicola]
CSFFHLLPPNLPLLPTLILIPPKHPLGSDPLSSPSLPEQGQLVRIFPAVSVDDEELVDQKKYLEERCKPQCVKSLYEYEKCVKRVENDDTGHKHCTGQYFDYWSCVDKCVAPKLFKKLK